jgi:hypothetical protein
MLRHQPSRIDLRAEDQKEMQAVALKALAEKQQAGGGKGQATVPNPRTAADRIGLVKQ